MSGRPSQQSPASAPDEREQYHPGSDAMVAAAAPDDAVVPASPTVAQIVREPAREIPVHAACDVLVVGGGPAGCAAAAAAARLGAEVILIERYNHLGGLSTGGLVIWIDRMTDWSGRRVIAGFGAELLEQLPADAVAGAPRELWGSSDATAVAYWRERQGAFRNVVTWSPMIDPEWLKLVSAELLRAAGVRFLFHSWVAAPVREGRRLRGVIFESKEGRRAVLARCVVDASGDLDVCAGAGAQFEADTKAPGGGVPHCVNTAWLWAGVDFKRWLAFKRDDPEGYRSLMEHARETLGFVERPVVGWRDDLALFLGPRLSGYSGLSVADLTRVEFESRRRMVAHLDYFRRNAPGFERAWPVLSAPQVGVRHTRRAVGLHRLSVDDWRAGVRHEDEIGVSPPPSQHFANVSVPYRSLVPRDLDNVLVAGRHIACDPQSQAFMREIPQCWMTGQAAGVAAALVARGDGSAGALDVAEIRAELRRQGAYLHPDREERPAGRDEGAGDREPASARDQAAEPIGARQVGGAHASGDRR